MSLFFVAVVVCWFGAFAAYVGAPERVHSEERRRRAEHAIWAGLALSVAVLAFVVAKK